MITHEEALNAADQLAEYCNQHFKGNSRECVTCQFSLETNSSRRCCLELYVGLWGDTIQQTIKKLVEKRNKELSCDTSQ